MSQRTPAFLFCLGLIGSHMACAPQEAEIAQSHAITTRVRVPPTLTANTCGGFGVPGGGANPVAEVPVGNKLKRYTLTTPGAVCNDGSPAIIYVRAPAVPSSRWVLFLQGGSHCSGYNDCYDRWCGVKHDAAKMSSLWAPAAIGSTGIFEETQAGRANNFDGYNQVYAYYCSSDHWQGQTEDTVTLRRPGSPPMTMYFRGGSIFDAMIDELKAGIAYSTGTLPSLTSATRVLLTGSSGGSEGAKHNLDHLTQDLLPGIDVRGVFDAGFGPSREPFPLYVTTQSERDAEELHDWNKRGDSDCLTFHAAAADGWKCGDGVHLAMNHITTPFFLRQDLQDSNLLNNRPDLPFAQYTWDALNTVGHLTQLAEDPTNPIPLAVTPGVFGPTCQKHEGIVLPAAFFTDYIGNPLQTYHNVLVSWLGGASVVALDARPTTTSPQAQGCF